MTEETKVVDGSQVATPEVVADTTTSSEVDYPALIAQKDAEIAKIREERENYKKGMLVAKGKLPDDGSADDDETAEERTRRIVQEELLTSKEAQLLAERKDAESKLMKENAELRLALKNQNVSTSSGSSTARETEGATEQTPASKFFSEAQLADLKKRGLDPDVVMKNLNKSLSSPVPPTA